VAIPEKELFRRLSPLRHAPKHRKRSTPRGELEVRDAGRNDRDRQLLRFSSELGVPHQSRQKSSTVEPASQSSSEEVTVERQNEALTV